MVPNLNTDQILPARYLKWPRAKGLGTVLFQDLRFDSDGKEKADFPLNQQPYRDARILIAARNFGGGSSREAAVYALYDHGKIEATGGFFGRGVRNQGTVSGVRAAST